MKIFALRKFLHHVLAYKTTFKKMFFFRYKFVTELDLPHDIVYEVMRPPATTEEKFWDKSLKHYERLATISDV